MRYLLAYLATLAVVVAIDAVWLLGVMKRLFEAHLGPLLARPLRYPAAILFYLLYAAGLLILAVAPAGSAGQALLLGGVVGLTAFGAYDLTNRATLAAWPLTIVAVDMAWGTALSGVAALAGWFAFQAGI